MQVAGEQAVRGEGRMDEHPIVAPLQQTASRMCWQEWRAYREDGRGGEGERGMGGEGAERKETPSSLSSYRACRRAVWSRAGRRLV